MYSVGLRPLIIVRVGFFLGPGRQVGVLPPEREVCPALPDINVLPLLSKRVTSAAIPTPGKFPIVRLCPKFTLTAYNAGECWGVITVVSQCGGLPGVAAFAFAGYSALGFGMSVIYLDRARRRHDLGTTSDHRRLRNRLRRRA